MRCRMSAGSWPGRVDRLGHERGAGVDVQPDEDVRRGAAAQHVGHGEDLTTRHVDDRRAGDADRGGDVTAREVARRHRGPEVGRPQDGPRVRRQCVDRVVLRRDEDTPGGLEWLAVDLAVERGGRPGQVGRVEGDTRGVHAGTEGLTVVDGPRRPGVHMGSVRGAAAGRRRDRDAGGRQEECGPGQRSHDPVSRARHVARLTRPSRERCCSAVMAKVLVRE